MLTFAQYTFGQNSPERLSLPVRAAGLPLYIKREYAKFEVLTTAYLQTTQKTLHKMYIWINPSLNNRLTDACRKWQ